MYGIAVVEAIIGIALQESALRGTHGHLKLPTCTVVGLQLDYGEGTGQGANKQASSYTLEWKEGYAPSLETLLI